MEKNLPVAENEAQIQDVPQKDITDSVLKRIVSLQNDEALVLPKNYNPGNALKSAWLTIKGLTDKNKRPALEVCTRDSVVNALFDMCIQALSPAKKQCYFIVRGDQLTLSRSYFGTCAALKRLNGIQDVYAQVIYQDDVFEYEIKNGNILVTKHEQKLSNIDMNKIIGAYSVILKDGEPRCEIMTMAQIKTAWSHTTTGGGVQREYPDQMAKRTVINRGAKMYVNTSDDDDAIIDAINRTTEAEYSDAVYTDFTDDNGEEVQLPSAPQTALPEAEQPKQVAVPIRHVENPSILAPQQRQKPEAPKRQPSF